MSKSQVLFHLESYCFEFIYYSLYLESSNFYAVVTYSLDF